MIINFEELNSIREKHINQKIVFCGGTFDLLHNGHVEYLKKIKEIGDVLVVAVTSDKRVKERKGEKRPVHNQDIRVTLVDAIRYVDYALIAPEPNENLVDKLPTVRILETLKPNIFTSGDLGWLKHKNEINSLGINFVVIPNNKINSTTEIIERIKNA